MFLLQVTKCMQADLYFLEQLWFVTATYYPISLGNYIFLEKSGDSAYPIFLAYCICWLYSAITGVGLIGSSKWTGFPLNAVRGIDLLVYKFLKAIVWFRLKCDT